MTATTLVPKIHDQVPSIQNPPPPTSNSCPESVPFAVEPGTLNSASSVRRRKPRGKIAELPQSQRELINQLLDDGANYARVRREMAQHGVKLNGENISNWFDSGYQAHLQDKLWITEMKAVREGASGLLNDYDPVKFHQAANQLATIQIFKSLKEEKFSDDPQSQTRILNVLARLGREALALAKYQELSRPEPDDEVENEMRDRLSLAHNLVLSRLKSPSPERPDSVYRDSSSSLDSAKSVPQPSATAHPDSVQASRSLADTLSERTSSPTEAIAATIHLTTSPQSTAAERNFATTPQPLPTAPQQTGEDLAHPVHPVHSVHPTRHDEIPHPDCPGRHPAPTIAQQDSSTEEPASDSETPWTINSVAPTNPMRRGLPSLWPPRVDRCSSCSSALPPLLPSGERPLSHCANCGATVVDS